MNFFTKNTIALALIVVIITPLSFGIFVPTAYAIPDDGNRGSSTISGAAGSLGCLAGGYIEGILGVGASIVGLVVPVNDSPVTSNTGAIKNKDCVLDGLTTVIREVLISSLTRSIVNWINSGFEGDPAFITDLEGFLLDVGDQVLGTYIEGSELAFLCSPFQINIRINLALDYYASTRDRVSCTLTGAIQNVQDSFGDFSSGNAWDSWFELSINPHNNAYGSFLGSRQAARKSVTSAQASQQSILDWGRGFKSYEVCDSGGTQDPNNSANISVGRFNCRIATPGVVINEQLSQVIGSGFRQLELADEINEIIGALLGQLANQVLGGSKNGFSGLSRNSFSQPSYVDQLVESSAQNSETEFRSYGLTVVDGSISTENQYISAKNVSVARLNASESLLESLSQCYADKLSTTQSPTLTLDERATATERMNSATSTITASLTPLQTLLTNEIEQAQNNISRLLVIKENLQNATSQFGVERVMENELDPLIKNKTIHSQPDFVIAQQQKEDIQDITEAMNVTTNLNLATCGEFPKRADAQTQ
ncbi:hypothetical protein HQ403_02035 [Candidatus Kaiserbacteria bacterium]|nr:hypothetical protein [Candidatus Kaiserbacteria bacterium]